MSERDRQQDDFAGLDAEEAESLREVADALRVGGAPEQDPTFWSAMQRRIMNEIEAVPGPREARSRSDAGAAVRRWLAAFRRPPANRVLVWAGMSGLAVLLAILLMPHDAPRESGSEIARPEPPAAPEGPSEMARAIEIPDDLWDEGFLAHSPLEVEVVWTASSSELDEVDDGASADPFGEFALEDTGWGLETLTDEELQELEQMLGG